VDRHGEDLDGGAMVTMALETTTPAMAKTVAGTTLPSMVIIYPDPA
jgi:hypothetical protein